MYKLELDIYNCLNSIHEVNNDELPLDYDFIKNKVGIYFNLTNVTDNEYKETITLDVHFYTLEENKIDLLKLVDTFDNALNKKQFENYWLTHKNIYLIPLKEEDKYHYILTYNVNKY